MKKTILCLFFPFLLASGCASNPVDSVKNGVLNLDKSTTIGDVFKGYKYFTNGEWKVIHDQQNRTIVQFSGTLPRFTKQFWNNLAENNHYFAKIEEDENPYIHKKVNKIMYIAQFKIDKDDTSKFNLSYSGLMFIGYNNEERDIEDGDELTYLRAIYKNNDELIEWFTTALPLMINSPNFFEKK